MRLGRLRVEVGVLIGGVLGAELESSLRAVRIANGL
jgi:hypothetical protein